MKQRTPSAQCDCVALSVEICVPVAIHGTARQKSSCAKFCGNKVHKAQLNICMRDALELGIARRNYIFDNNKYNILRNINHIYIQYVVYNIINIECIRILWCVYIYICLYPSACTRGFLLILIIIGPEFQDFQCHPVAPVAPIALNPWTWWDFYTSLRLGPRVWAAYFYNP